MHFGETQDINDAAFEVFKEHREEIESQVDCDREWVQDENRRWLIQHAVGVGYEDEDQWEKAHEELTESMAQLEEEVEPYLDDARQAAEQFAEREESGDLEEARRDDVSD
jgi:hypothetical protein